MVTIQRYQQFILKNISSYIQNIPKINNIIPKLSQIIPNYAKISIIISFVPSVISTAPSQSSSGLSAPSRKAFPVFSGIRYIGYRQKRQALIMQPASCQVPVPLTGAMVPILRYTCQVLSPDRYCPLTGGGKKKADAIAPAFCY